eukprot:190945-Chlamydomonas_euryale.AAC.12
MQCITTETFTRVSLRDERTDVKQRSFLNAGSPDARHHASVHADIHTCIHACWHANLWPCMQMPQKPCI